MADFDYIVVGSGAGGGTVAARLALAGRNVLVLEAGGDAVATGDEDSARLPEDYQVPCFHPFATENPGMRWDFWVKHYADETRQQRDPKYCASHKGILYPRAGTLGGCTAHNALVTVYPHNSDWDYIASLTGDSSWSARNMRRYFERLEDCRYRPFQRLLKKLFRLNPSRHGFDGWLATERAIPLEALEDGPLLECIKDSATIAALRNGKPLERLRWFLEAWGDPNDWRLVKDNAIGVRLLPLATSSHARRGTREFLIETARRHPDRLRIELHALATRVLFDQQGRATGVEYLKGRRLFRADPGAGSETGELRQAYAAREVILAGGAFNTPHLLMLSGIGPADELKRHGIDLRADLPVGRNLQDRYEASVVNRMKAEWSILKDARFDSSDPLFKEWAMRRGGVYTTNGGVLSVITKSCAASETPDLFLFAFMGKFYGYFPGWADVLPDNPNYLSWAILKAHTVNTAGTVTLRSADPLDPPDVNFHYFDEGNDAGQRDLEAVVDGILFVRYMTDRIANQIEEEELPGKHISTREELRQFIRDNAWGHHASCTCPIGPREAGGVLDADFRVHGVPNLRVVDASVFPRIPGFFIMTPIYMVGEKAADAILKTGKR